MGCDHHGVARGLGGRVVKDCWTVELHRQTITFSQSVAF
jgi:hypothetical protein